MVGVTESQSKFCHEVKGIWDERNLEITLEYIYIYFSYYLYPLPIIISIKPLTSESYSQFIFPNSVTPTSHNKVMRIKEMITN